MKTKRRVLETLLVIGFSLGCAWLWFVPVFWEMAGTDQGFLSGLLQVFFSLDDHKRHLGSGIDFLGTVWILPGRLPLAPWTREPLGSTLASPHPTLLSEGVDVKVPPDASP